MATDVHPHHDVPADLNDKVFTYRWFVAALRLIILTMAAAAIFALLVLFTNVNWLLAAALAAVTFGAGARLILGCGHLEDPPSDMPGT